MLARVNDIIIITIICNRNIRNICKGAAIFMIIDSAVSQ